MIKIRVSELVTIDKVNSWRNGDIITISAGTGDGKSYFIKNNLYAVSKRDNKKILFLLHRKNCVDQFYMEINKAKKTDVIEIMTYQKIEHLIKIGETFNFSQYQYVVCDEFHYFLQDASFNITTDISLNAILKQTDITRIFMSATGKDMKGYISGYKKLEIISYDIPVNFNFIQSLTFYNNDESLDEFIKLAIENNQKAIFFIESAEKAYNLYKKYKDYAIFNCSKSNDKYYKYVDEEKINTLLQNERFDELILITTTTMDAGVNIIDTDLQNILCDVKDTKTLIQCIGRKRQKNKDDKVHLTIKTINNKQLGGMITNINKKRDMAKYLWNNGIDKYIDKYQREYDKSNIVYVDKLEDGTPTLKVNDLMYFKCLIDCKEYDMMLKNYDGFGYCKFLAHKFGFYDEDFNSYEYTVWEDHKKKETLKDYLEKIIGKKLYKEEQKELINKIDLRVDGKQQKSNKKLNEGLEMVKLPFVIVKNVDKRRKLDDGTDNPNRDKTFWMVVESMG